MRSVYGAVVVGLATASVALGSSGQAPASHAAAPRLAPAPPVHWSKYLPVAPHQLLHIVGLEPAIGKIPYSPSDPKVLVDSDYVLTEGNLLIAHQRRTSLAGGYQDEYLNRLSTNPKSNESWTEGSFGDYAPSTDMRPLPPFPRVIPPVKFGDADQLRQEIAADPGAWKHTTFEGRPALVTEVLDPFGGRFVEKLFVAPATGRPLALDSPDPGYPDFVEKIVPVTILADTKANRTHLMFSAHPGAQGLP